jgi:hypothetical protein
MLADEAVETIVVPFVGGRRREVPLLGRQASALLYRVGAFATSRAQHRLKDGVVGYRSSDGSRIDHYRDAYRRRVVREAALAGKFHYVAVADIERFFESTTPDWLEHCLQPFVSEPDMRQLKRVFGETFSRLGYSLAPGYIGTRAIANLCLVPPDDSITSPFTRWIDDYRVFASSKSEALQAIESLDAALMGTPYRLTSVKTSVQTPRTLQSTAVNSLGDEHGEVGSISIALTMLQDSRDSLGEQRYEQLLRHLLRIAAERTDPSALGLLEEMQPEDIPPASVPRLAWYLATVSEDRRARSILEQQLMVEDEYRPWRSLRLAYSLWFFREADSQSILPRLLPPAAQSMRIALIGLRVAAKCGSPVIHDLADIHGLSSEVVSQVLATERGTGTALGPPPIQTYL